MVAKCTICDGSITVADNVMEGELFICPDCGTELEVISMDPLTLEEAPEVQEDWGE